MQPVQDPAIGTMVANHLLQMNLDEGELPTATGTPFRFSEALSCSRKIAYRVSGAKGRDFDSASLNNFWVGDKLHGLIQEAICKADPGWEAEVTVTLPEPNGHLASGHADAVHKGNSVAAEFKSVGGSAWRKAVGIKSGYNAKRTAAEGPKGAHIVQGALAAYGAHCDWLVIGYASKEAVSVKNALNAELNDLERWWAEWWFPFAEIEHLALAEIQRLKDLHEFMADYYKSDPIIALPHKVSPMRGRDDLRGYESFAPGESWECDYCQYSDDCLPARVSTPLALVASRNVRFSING